MSTFRIYPVICFIFIICILPLQATAKDISTLQTALSVAREDMEKAKENQAAASLAVTQQQQIIAERKKQLADENAKLEKMQKEVKRSKEQFLETQHKLEKAQANLDAAWGKQ